MMCLLSCSMLQPLEYTYADVETFRMKTNQFRHAQMVGSDKRMDEQGNFDLPINALPVKCQRCSFPDLDYVPQPYLLGKGIKDPNELALAEVGNFFVRERT